MMPKVEFHFDFGSPNAYFAHKVLPAIEERTGVEFGYVPILPAWRPKGPWRRLAFSVA
jgi:2-hydroxychromene-2-carboxylate isomerase